MLKTYYVSWINNFSVDDVVVHTLFKANDQKDAEDNWIDYVNQDSEADGSVSPRDYLPEITIIELDDKLFEGMSREGILDVCQMVMDRERIEEGLD